MMNAGSHRDFDLIKVVEALKAVKEVDVNIDGRPWASCLQSHRLLPYFQIERPQVYSYWMIAGLKELDRAVTGHDRASVLTDFLARSPSCSEIHAIWDAQLTVGMTAKAHCCQKHKHGEGHVQAR